MIQSNLSFDNASEVATVDESLGQQLGEDRKVDDFTPQTLKSSITDYIKTDASRVLNKNYALDSEVPGEIKNQNKIIEDDLNILKEPAQAPKDNLQSKTQEKSLKAFYPKLSIAYSIDQQTKFILIFIAVLLFFLVISTTSKMFESIIQVGMEKEDFKGMEI